MNIKTEKPPIWGKLEENFGVKWGDVIVTYGDNVYCPVSIHEMKLAHESVHVFQQTEMDKDVWWDKYIKDKDFRLSQEIEAYKFEIEWIKANVKDRNVQARLIHRILVDISSPMYGNIITYSKARELLTPVNK